MEFIGRPRESSLAAIISQMQARRNDPIAQGILQAGQAIGGGIAARGQNARADDARQAAATQAQQSSIMELLGKGGSFTDASGAPMDLTSMLPKLGLPAGAKYVPQAQKQVVQVTPEIIANYPKIASMGYAPGDAIPSAVFIAQTRETKEDKTRVEVTPELAKKYPGLIPGSSVPATHMSTLEQKESVASEKKAAADEQKKSAMDSAKTHATNVIDAAEKASKLIGFSTTGMTGAAMSKVSGSKRKSLEGYIDTLKANLSFERLQEMRNNSKTGGALGAVSDTEMRLLSSSAAALDPNQEDTVLKENITKVKNQYQVVLDKLNAAATPDASSSWGPDKEARLNALRAKVAAKGKK